MDGERGASSCGARGDRRGRGTASYVIAQTIPIAYAEIDIDSVGQVEVRHGSASVFDVERAFLHGRAQCARIADAHHIKAVAPDFYHLFVPIFRIGADKVLLLLIRSTLRHRIANRLARR